MLFKEMMAVYSNNHSQYQNSFCGQSTDFLVFEIDGAYTIRNYCALKLYIRIIKGTFWTVLNRPLRNKGGKNSMGSTSTRLSASYVQRINCIVGF